MANAIGARTASDMTVAGQLAFFKNILESSIDYSGSGGQDPLLERGGAAQLRL
jgi:hypothetical protein